MPKVSPIHYLSALIYSDKRCILLKYGVVADVDEESIRSGSPFPGRLQRQSYIINKNLIYADVTLNPIKYRFKYICLMRI